MTFKHEYLVPADHPNKEYAHKGKADQCEYEIGKHIARTFGWEKVENSHFTFLGDMGESEGERMKLEIEAFPIDKWIRFKERLLNYVGDEPAEVEFISEIIEELEAFGNTVTTNNG